MEVDYILTSEQREAWAAFLGAKWARRGQAELARQLVRLAKGTPASWASTLSKFKKGDREALEKIFRRTKILDAVAGSIGLKAAELHAKLGAIRSPGGPDVRTTWRLAGFADYPAQPILDVFHPPWVTRSSSTLEGGPAATLGGGGLLDLGAVAEQCREPGRVIVLAGERGTGRTAALRAIAVTLSSRGVQVAWSLDAGNAQVLVADDLDGLPAHDRAVWLEAVIKGRCSLVSTVDRGMPIDLGHAARVVYTLDRGPRAWIDGLLSRIEACAPTVVGRALDLDDVRRWLDADPLAVSLCHRADVAGAIARVVANGAPLQQALHALVDVCVEQAVARLRGLRLGGEANFIAHYGATLIRALSAGSSFSLAEAMTAVSGLGGQPRSTALDAAAIVDALERGGLVVRTRDGLHWSPPVLRPLAMGKDLRGPVLERALLDPDLELALVAAVEHDQDCAPLLRRIEGLPDEAQCAAMPALTRVLATPVACNAPAVFRRSFMRALAWWLRWPVQAAQLSVTLSVLPQAEIEPPREDRVSGVSPFRMLALASIRHADCLPACLTLADVRRTGVTPAAHDAYLTLIGAVFRDDTETGMLLRVAAPGQSLTPEDRDFWAALRGAWRGSGELRHLTRIAAAELVEWWTQIAGGRIAASAGGAALVSGTGGVPIETFIVGGGRDERWWPEALERALKESHPRAPAAFAAAACEALRLGGQPLTKTIQGLWGAAPAGVRAAMRDALYRELVDHWGVAEVGSRSGFGDRGDGSLQRWIATTALGGDQRGRLWEAWLELQLEVAPRERRMPWQAFTGDEDDDVRIAHWAAACAPPPEERWPAGDALAHILQGGGLLALRVLVDAASIDPRWQAAAAIAIADRHGAERQTRLAIAATTTNARARMTLAQGITAELGEGAVWAAVAAAEVYPPARLRYLAAAAYAQDADGAWDTLIAAVSDTAQQHQSDFVFDLALQDIALYARLGHNRRPAAVKLFVTRVIATDAIRRLFSDMTHLLFWVAAERTLGWAETCAALAIDGPTLQLSRLVGFASLDDYTERVVELALGGALVEPAAFALAARRPERALQFLRDHTLLVRGALTPAARALVEVLLRTRPSDTVDLLERRLGERSAGRGARTAWAWIVPRTPPGELRRRAHARYLASGRPGRRRST